VDVLSTDDWALDMVPRPALALLMVFPIKEASEAHRAEEKSKIEKDGQIVSDSVWYIKQYVGNACGTVGLLHAVLNNTDKPEIELSPGSFLHRFYESTKGMSPEDAGHALEEDDGLETSHEVAAAMGQSEIVEQVNAHFVTFTCIDGNLYELDGRKAFPINHGSTTSETLLEDAIKIVKQFMARDPNEVNFSLVALTGGSGEA
jgi:ubiquitin carboxyl-terminal hydrolase L3